MTIIVGYSSSSGLKIIVGGNVKNLLRVACKKYIGFQKTIFWKKKIERLPVLKSLSQQFCIIMNET